MMWLLVGLIAFDLAGARQEPNLERRSELALDNATSAISECSQAYRDGDIAKTKAEASEIEESVTLAYDALHETGKDARRSPKYFKHAELTTRQMVRRLDGLIQSMSLADRTMLLYVRDRVSDIHDELLTDMMKKKN